jgi:hypothetical protein
VVYCKYMDNTSTTSLCFTAYDYQRIFVLSSAFLALCLGSGCTSSSGALAGNALAQPPRYDISAVEVDDISVLTAREAPFKVAGKVEPYVVQDNVFTETVGYKTKGTAKKSCRLKDRFDRKELVAYEWGQNRMGFDLDGLDLMAGGMEVENVQFSYRLRLQDYKTKKERCRYASSWQGLLGSGYNELVAREDSDTVWRELEAMEDRYAPW